MKRRIISTIFTALVLLVGCSTAEDTSVGTMFSDEYVAPVATAPLELTSISPTHASPVTKNTPDTEQNTGGTKADIEVMLPILDSIVRVTGIAGDTEYAPDDPEFIWMVLYLTGSNWGEIHPFVVPGDDSYTVIQMGVLYDFACAASSMYIDEVLPELPQSMQNSVKYDANNDEYVFSPTDMGSTMTKIDDISTLQDGSIIAIVGLYDSVGNPEDHLGSVSFTLAKKLNVDENRNTNYLYTVTGATKIPKQ